MEDILYSPPRLQGCFEPSPDYILSKKMKEDEDQFWDGSVPLMPVLRLESAAQPVEEHKEENVPAEVPVAAEEESKAETGVRSWLANTDKVETESRLSRNIRNGFPISLSEKKPIITLSLGMFNSISSDSSTPKLACQHDSTKFKTPRKISFNMEETEKKGAKCCNCKKSKCLKLYCECFASGGCCEGCSCTDCHNTPEFQEERVQALSAVQFRNPVALQRKMSTNFARPQTAAVRCNCSKSGCQKGYCECFKNGMACNATCGCLNCKNMPALCSLAILECGPPSGRHSADSHSTPQK